MRKYTDPVINYGCKRVAAKNGKAVPEHKQPKDITREWYIYYTYLDPETGKMRPVKYKAGINCYHTERERIKSAMNACEIVQEMLDKGFNPFLKRMQHRDDDNRLWLFSEALDHILKIYLPTISEGSRASYRSVVKITNEHAAELDKSAIPMKEVTRKQVRTILNHIQQERKFGNVRYNAFVNILKTLFGVMIEEEILTHNVLYQMRSLPPEDPVMFEPLTKEELRRVFEVTVGWPQFHLCCLLVYTSGFREKELLSFKVKEYSRADKIAHISGKTKRKTGVRMVPIFPGVSELLEAHIDGIDPEFNVFGKGLLPERRDKPWQRNRLSEIWKHLIKDGLGIDKDMYGLKHTGADDKIDADVPDEWIKNIFGHSSIAMTEKYMRRSKKKKLQKMIAAAPNFLPEQESGKG